MKTIYVIKLEVNDDGHHIIDKMFEHKEDAITYMRKCVANWMWRFHEKWAWDQEWTKMDYIVQYKKSPQHIDFGASEKWNDGEIRVFHGEAEVWPVHLYSTLEESYEYPVQF